MKARRLFTAISLAALFLAESPARPGSAPARETGRIVATTISAYSMTPQVQSKRALSEDLWWTYTVCARDRTYVAVSRESPGRSGLTIDAEVKFSATKSRIAVTDPKGGQHVMLISRLNTTKGCPAPAPPKKTP